MHRSWSESPPCAWPVSIEKQQRASGVPRFKGATLLLSVMAFQMAAATFWAFSERIGTASGLAESDIATAVAFGNLGGVPASLLGAFAGDRFGYLPILVLATVAAVGGEIVMSGATAPAAYLMGQVVFNFGWILGVSYYLALLSKRARNPRLIQGAPIALVTATALGPLWVALFRAESSAPLLALSLVLCGVALLPGLFHRS